MGTQKITNILTLTATLVLVTLGVVSTSNAMPMNPNVGKIEARGICLECEIAQRDAGLNKTQIELLQMVSVISPNGREPRLFQKRDGEGKQFAPIGSITSENDQVVGGKNQPGLKATIHGTAFLVSPCLIMTNSHVVFGNNLNPASPEKYKMKFEAGEKGGANYEIAEATPIKFGLRGSLTDYVNDWTLLQLDKGRDGKCMGERIGWLNPVNTDENAIDHQLFTAAGFPSDRSKDQLTIQKDCRLIYNEANGDAILSTTCPGVTGNSGGPVLTMSETGAPQVVGMMTSSNDPTGKIYKSLDKKNMNFAVESTAVFQDVHLEIAKDRTGKSNVLDVKPSQISSNL